jgi:hypothetical protein
MHGETLETASNTTSHILRFSLLLERESVSGRRVGGIRHHGFAPWPADSRVLSAIGIYRQAEFPKVAFGMNWWEN